MADVVAFTIPGKAHGKIRPRHGKGFTYTDAATVQAEKDVLSQWQAAGSVRLPDDAAIHLAVTVFCERPKSHYKRDGTLSAEGLRHPYPENQKPDFDNLLKTVTDALNKRAWRDDVQIVSQHYVRAWGQRAQVDVWAVPFNEVHAFGTAAPEGDAA